MRKLLNLSFPLFILSLFLFGLLFLDFRDTSEEYRHEGKSNRECGRYIGDHALNRRLKHLLCNGNGRQIHNTPPWKYYLSPQLREQSEAGKPGNQTWDNLNPEEYCCHPQNNWKQNADISDNALQKWGHVLRRDDRGRDAEIYKDLCIPNYYSPPSPSSLKMVSQSASGFNGRWYYLSRGLQVHPKSESYQPHKMQGSSRKEDDMLTTLLR